jgi:hypothetical protein
MRGPCCATQRKSGLQGRLHASGWTTPVAEWSGGATGYDSSVVDILYATVSIGYTKVNASICVPVCHLICFVDLR